MKDEGSSPPRPPDWPRRNRILRTAERLFIHYGPSKTTIADIARACGIGVGSVYLDFASKEAIVQELATEKSRIVADRMRAAAQAAGVLAQERLVAALEARVLALLDFTKDGQHACDLVRCDTQRQHGFDLGEEPRVALREILEAGIAAGELEGGEPDELATTIELAFGCLSPPHLFRFERSVAEEKATHLSILIVYGLGKRPARPRRR